MSYKETISAVIPVRAGSRRLPNKNILPFGDTNLLIHKIRQLKEVENLNTIVVSSDSQEMLQMAQNESKNSKIKIITHQRPIEYCDEKTKTFNEVVEYVAKAIEDDIIMWSPCTCPLVTAKKYDKAIEAFRKKVLIEKKYDSVISAKIFKEYLYGEKGPINWNPEKHVPSQQLPEWKVIVNGFYIAKRDDMIDWKYFYGKNPYIEIISKKEALDIDDIEDYKMCQAMW